MSYDDIPDEWGHAGGESARPLHEGGYYLNVFTRPISGNQHYRRYYELRVDTANYVIDKRGPTNHVAELTIQEENFNDGDTREIDYLGRDVVNVDTALRNDEETQQQAEVEIMAKAVKLIEERIDE